MLPAALKPPAVVSLLVSAFVAAILWALHRLWHAEGTTAEQSAIGLAAKVGNGLVLSVLGLLVLGWRNAPVADLVVFSTLMVAVYSAAVFVLVSRPHEVIIGYKG